MGLVIELVSFRGLGRADTDFLLQLGTLLSVRQQVSFLERLTHVVA